MALGIPGIAVATAPSAVAQYLKHFLYHRSQRKGKPTAQISYDEGLTIIRKFLAYASTHTLSEIQAFTSNAVPTPRWVSRVKVVVPEKCIDEATVVLRKQLERDPGGVQAVGGPTWWTMRGRELSGEWLEMKKDKLARGGRAPERVLLYVHGGAYFFSSLETHRYQIQRHARKLGARAFAPSYRLAPQYPFPCGLLDVLASYLFLIDPPAGSAHTPVLPENIIVSGDSAGAGAVLSLLVILRDQNLPLPAGGTLISPWVDLAHSFPSVMGDDSGDYIPSDGFHYRPGLAWPPMKGDGIVAPFGQGDEAVLLDDQIQMYCSNRLLNHPLVSPVNQGSLGGLPPLMVMGGSVELLRDEIMYVAHKAAAPQLYPPSSATSAAYPVSAGPSTYPPTSVHLSIYDGTAHVTPTLSITRPAKFMYRGAANFGIWALTAAKKKRERHARHAEARANGQAPSRSSTLNSSHTASSEPGVVLHPADADAANDVDHPVDSEEESELSSDEDDLPKLDGAAPDQRVRVTGREPPFVEHMVRERVSPFGVIRPMEPPEELPACTMPSEHIGAVHPGPVNKWLAKRAKWDAKYSKDLLKFRALKQEDRAKAEANGYLNGLFPGERPPLCSLAGWHDTKLAIEAADSVDETGKKTNSALVMWNKLSSKPDEDVVADEEKEGEADRMHDPEEHGDNILVRD